MMRMNVWKSEMGCWREKWFHTTVHVHISCWGKYRQKWTQHSTDLHYNHGHSDTEETLHSLWNWRFFTVFKNSWLSTDSFHVTTLISQGSYELRSNLEQLVLICKYQTSVCHHHISIHGFTAKLAFCMATTVIHVTICGSIFFTILLITTYQVIMDQGKIWKSLEESCKESTELIWEEDNMGVNNDKEKYLQNRI